MKKPNDWLSYDYSKVDYKALAREEQEERDIKAGKLARPKPNYRAGRAAVLNLILNFAFVTLITGMLFIFVYHGVSEPLGVLVLLVYLFGYIPWLIKRHSWN